MDADKEVGEGLWDLRADRSEYPTSETVPVGAAAAGVSAQRNGESSTEEALAKLSVEEANTVPWERSKSKQWTEFDWKNHQIWTLGPQMPTLQPRT